jgi:hypothetical protein
VGAGRSDAAVFLDGPARWASGTNRARPNTHLNAAARARRKSDFGVYSLLMAKSMRDSPRRSFVDRSSPTAPPMTISLPRVEWAARRYAITP